MLDKLKDMPQKLLEFWNKYNTKQKTIIISVVVTVLLAIGILVFALTRTTYTHLVTLTDSESVTQMQGLLDGEGISYKTEQATGGYEISVDSSKTTDAMLLLGSSDVVEKVSGGMDWETALDNSIDTTETEKQKKYALAYQSDIRKYLMTIDNVEDAYISMNVPEDDGTILSEDKDTSVAVMLKLSKELDSSAIQGMANYLAAAVGNSDTNLITIIDSAGNLLFDGSSSDILKSPASAAEYTDNLRALIKNDLKQMLLKANYNEVEVGASNIQFNMDQVSELYTEYSTPEGQDNGPYSQSYQYKSEGNNSSAGIPGTDSNSDDTDYMIQSGGSSNNSVTLDKFSYDNNKRETTTVKAVGAMDTGASSVAIVLKKYTVYDEEQMQKNGELEGTDFETFQSQNSEPTELEVDDNVIELVSKATGISTNNISVIAYDQPVFNAAVETPVEYSNIMMIILAVLIIALLVFVVFKGTAPMEVTELEPELSVEQLLATTKENQSLEDIEFGEKSETRKMIEKFVDENPDAVAQLLRNWINEDWG